jgi:hypothetical protein
MPALARVTIGCAGTTGAAGAGIGEMGAAGAGVDGGELEMT